MAKISGTRAHWRRATRFYRRNRFAFISLFGIGIFVFAAATLLFADANKYGFLNERSYVSAFRKFAHLVYTTAQMFSLEAQQESFENPLFASAAFLALFFIGYAVIRLLPRVFDTFWLACYGWRGDHVVICGLGRIGRQLVEDYREGDVRHRVVVIEKDKANPDLNACRDMGAIVVIGDATDPEVLCRAGAAKAAEVFAVTGCDESNLAVAVLVSQENRQGPSFQQADALPSAAHAALPEPSSPAQNTEQKYLCHAHLIDPDYVDTMRKMAMFKWPNNDDSVSFFGIYDNTARQLMRDELARHAPGPGQINHYFLFGFGPMGQAIALQAARQAHFLNRRRLRMTVFDDSADATLSTRFRRRYPAFCPQDGALDLAAPPAGVDAWDYFNSTVRPAEAARVDDHFGTAVEYACNAEFQRFSHSVDDYLFHDMLARRLAQPGVAPVFIICFDENDNLNFQTACRLREYLVRRAQINPGCVPAGIYAWLPRITTLAQLLHELDVIDGALVSMAAFGQPRKACNRQQIVNPMLEQFAQRIHARYLETNPGAPWNQIDEFGRERNRQAADHLFIKAREAGYLATPSPHSLLPAVPATLRDPLAEMEHNRWMADILLCGAKYDPHRDPLRMLRPTLKPWSQFTLSEKDNDLQQVDNLHAWMPDVLRLTPQWKDA